MANKIYIGEVTELSEKTMRERLIDEGWTPPEGLTDQDRAGKQLREFTRKNNGRL
ncbi:MAG: hypothetical protein JKX96_01065 [Acinetobacter sp.]|nr:hypothetical protein [Acinetobacter sp.]